MWLTPPLTEMLGFHSFHDAQHTLGGIELICIIKKGQIVGHEGETLSAAGQFYALAS
jgi:putative transposase